jgi:1-acyl-sn-glycerol-3-phosphate acyltransferase
VSAPVTRPAVRLLARAVVSLFTHTSVSGRGRLPARGPLLVVFNHLGHLDGPLLIAKLPYDLEAMALSDLYDVPATGLLLRLYGAIAVHRDAADRTVISKARGVLKRDGVLMLAPEARMSITGALERARDGAAYLALKSGAAILPVALTGTETSALAASWKSWRRPQITVTIGQVFQLPNLPLDGPRRKQSLAEASAIIMTHIAALLPPSYRGVYATSVQTERSDW